MQQVNIFCREIKCNIGLCWLSLSYPFTGFCGLIVVKNEVYVSNCGLRRGLIFSYLSVQRVGIVNLVKEIKRGSATSRRSTFKRNFGKSQQEEEDVFEGDGRRRKTTSHIIVFLSTLSSMFINRF